MAMHTLPILGHFLLLAALAMPATGRAEAAAPSADSLTAAFVLTLGREPSARERDEWTQPSTPPALPGMIAQLRQRLGSEPALRHEVAIAAAQDAWGRAPREDEIAVMAKAEPVRIYTEQLQHHLAKLAADPGAYAQVLHRAYRLVVGREAYPEEVAYWNSRDTLSFVLLAGCIEHWARRNQPGLMVTTGAPTIAVNSYFLTTVRLAPAVAAQARVAVGLGSDQGRAEADAAGRNIVAPGAGAIRSSGRIHFVAAGAKELRATALAAK